MKKAAADVIAAEQARCEAWGGVDVGRLDDLLDDGIWYIHTNGKTDTKAGLIELAKAGWHVTRENLRVTVYDDVAVMTGQIVIAPLASPDPASTPRWVSNALQVWRRTGDRWRLVAQQSTALPA